MSAFFDSGGVRIHFTVEGPAHADAVILLHGFSSTIAMQWRVPKITELLAQDYRVVAMDFRGHGKSDKPHDATKYGAHLADDAVRLLDHLGIERAHVVGYSMGGRVVGKVVAGHPERVHSAVIAGMGLVGDEHIPIRQHADLAASLESSNGLVPLLRELSPPNRPVPPDDRLREASNVYLRNQDLTALAAVVRGTPTLAVSLAKLKTIGVPMLGLIGEEDPYRDRLEQMGQLVPNMRVIVIPGARHLTAYARSEFKSALKQFLDERRSQSAG